MTDKPRWLQFLDAFPATSDLGDWWRVVHEIEGFQYLEMQEEAEKICREHRLAFSQLPIGTSKNGIITFDGSIGAVESGEPGILILKENGFWKPCDHHRSRSYTENVAFAHMALRGADAEKTGDEDSEVSLLASLYRCPIYTAASVEQVEKTMERVKTLHQRRGAESLSHRLSSAGLNGEQWRIVGAERAIAGKTRDALVSLTGAHYLGAKLSMIVLPASQSLGNAGWKWANSILKVHKRAAKG